MSVIPNSTNNELSTTTTVSVDTNIIPPSGHFFWQKEMQDLKFSGHNSIFWNTNIHHPIFSKI